MDAIDTYLQEISGDEVVAKGLPAVLKSLLPANSTYGLEAESEEWAAASASIKSKYFDYLGSP